MNIELEIDGISDRAVTEAIRKRVKILGKRVDRPEDWRVRLVPSETRAEWDLGIHTGSKWHIAWFAAPVRRLADIVEQRLREQLADSAAAVDRVHHLNSANAMAAAIAIAGPPIRNRRRTRWSCTRPCASHAAHRLSKSAALRVVICVTCRTVCRR